MYEDEKYSINWLKIILRVLIAFLVVLITIKLIMMINNNKGIIIFFLLLFNDADTLSFSSPSNNSDISILKSLLFKLGYLLPFELRLFWRNSSL